LFLSKQPNPFAEVEIGGAVVGALIFKYKMAVVRAQYKMAVLLSKPNPF